jgi:hypothetical protein
MKAHRKDDPKLAKLTPPPPPCFVGPRGKTQYGTVVEVLREGGCGTLHVRKVGDREASPYVCHVDALTGVTPNDQARLDALKSGQGLSP